MSFSSRCLLFLLCAASLFASDLNSGGLTGVHTVKSASPLGLGGVNVGGTFRYGREWDFISSSNVNREKSPQLFDGDLFVGVGVGRHWDLALHVPFHADMPGWDDITTAGVGDLEVSTRMTLPVNAEKAVINAALLFTLTTPTGQYRKGALTRYTYYDPSTFYTGDRLYYSPGAAMTIHFDRSRTGHPVRVHLNAGSVLSNKSELNAATGGLGVEVFPTEWLTLFAETYGTLRYERMYWDKFYTHANNGQLWVSPGARFNIGRGVYMILSGDFGLSEPNQSAHETYSRGDAVYTSKDNALFNVRYTVGWERKGKPKDIDEDGIPNKLDNCPNAPEDFDGFNDGDGCPELDNDNDSIPDASDKCVNDPEDFDGFNDEDGCPEFDNDEDNIPDSVDNCPDQLEDLDGFEDGDGCPELDNDKDGFVDSLDNCVNDPEDQDGFEDNDGCPEYDNDGDSVPDSLDQCPGVPGTVNGKGCPEAKEISREGLVLKGVTFATGKAVLKPESFEVLDEVVESLKAWPEVKLEVQGHTDASGSRKTNIRISRARAETVKRYLVEKGVSASRLTAKGYGPDKPIASNSTAKGRSENRRVELKRTDSF